MIYPFHIDKESKDFADKHYPSLETLRKIRLVNFNERLDIVRIYFTEGIPFAFLNNPILYEKIRDWLGKHFNVNPKSISITGSGRIGYSLNPYKLQGKKFSNESDLDFFIVDQTLFNDIVKDYFKFVELLSRRIGSNIKDYETLINNSIQIQKNISFNGFVDQEKIPNWNGLPKINLVYSRLDHLKKRMHITDNCPQIRKTSVRIYKDWGSCINQLSINISSALK